MYALLFAVASVTVTMTLALGERVAGWLELEAANHSPMTDKLDGEK